jgi:hypothetical protein
MAHPVSVMVLVLVSRFRYTICIGIVFKCLTLITNFNHSPVLTILVQWINDFGENVFDHYQ